ncbi:MAG: hypothetical protein ABR543_15515 [Gemmatimonadaceae bacterium]
MLPLVLSVLACGCADSKSSDVACDAPGDVVVKEAVTQYLKNLTPTPQRYLIATGTDSALPGEAHAALQNKGPTWFFPADSASQDKMREILASKGDFTTLLVTYRGTRHVDDSHAVVRIGGRYVGGEHEGRAASSRALHFQCDTSGWTWFRVEEEG